MATYTSQRPADRYRDACINHYAISMSSGSFYTVADRERFEYMVVIWMTHEWGTEWNSFTITERKTIINAAIEECRIAAYKRR